MKTFLDNLINEFNKVKKLFEELILKHSNIYKWNTDCEEIFFVSPDGDYAFKELNPDGKKIQSELFQLYNHSYNLVSVLLKNQVEPTIEDLITNHNILIKYINHNSSTWYKNITDVYNEINDAINKILLIINDLYNVPNMQNIFIPDTNALIQNPNIDAWLFEDKPFTVLLIPTILSELDKLKIEHRNPDVKEKAKSVINRIKGFRNRGSMFEGVILKKGISYLKSIAVEPNFMNTLNWLDEKNNDDRFIATYFEIFRSYPSYNVSIVTSDINLQNKADFSLIPFVEPPELNPLNDK